MDWIELGNRGMVSAERIIGVGLADATAMKRLIATTQPALLLDYTGGTKRRTVLAMDSGHVVLSSLALDEIGRLLTES